MRSSFLPGTSLSAICLAFAPLMVACGSGVQPPSVVVWVEVDTLRADRLGCYGFPLLDAEGVSISPHIDAIAREGVLFENAYSTAPWTVPSVVSQFTGLYPWEHGALRIGVPIDAELETVAERFRAAGWRTAGVSTNLIATRAQGFDQGFELWDDGLAKGHEGATGGAAVERLLELADEASARPASGLFLFVLLFEPHWRYEELGPGRFGSERWSAAPAPDSLRPGEELPELRARLDELSENDIAHLRHRYLGEVERVDDALGVLREGLEQRALWEDALVVFTADHGEELLERGWLGHTRTLFDELVRVPLILRGPGLPAGERRAVPVSQVDLEASVRGLAGIAPIGGGLGEALEGEVAPRRHLFLHSDFAPFLDTPEAALKRTHKWGVVDAQTHRKWIVDHLPVGGGAPVGSLFDLAADASEQRDLALEPGGAELAGALWLRPELSTGERD